MDLMPHQRAALERLDEAGGCQLLNLCPGAGKTLIALSHINVPSLGATLRTLIVCPVTLTSTWDQEAHKWFDLSVMQAKGRKEDRLAVYEQGWLVAVGYETFRMDFEHIMKQQWDMLICDESHKLKSPTAQVTKKMMKLAKKVPRRILLSGTPLVNSWIDMWSQIEIVHPGALYGNFYAFRSMHAIMPVPGIPMIRGWRGVDQIKEKIAPYIFTVPKEEIQAALPPVTFVDVPVELTPKEKKAYAEIRDEFRVELEEAEDLTIANALVKVGRLRQCVNGVHAFGIEDEGSKLKALKELLETLQGEHVIIFSMYAQTCDRYAAALATDQVITGATTGRDEVIGKWRRAGGPLILSGAGEAGLNLQDACYVIQVEPPWTRASQDQRVGRSWRTGQKRPVTVYSLLATDSVDYGVKKMIEKKGKMADEVAGITIQDLRDLV